MFRHPLAAVRLLGQPRRDRPRNHPRPLGARLSPQEIAPSGPAGELSRDSILAAVEAALFLADEPLTPRKLATLAGLPDSARAKAQVTRLQAMYSAEGSAFEVEEIAGGYQLLTRAEFHPWLARLRSQAGDSPLSAPVRETLTIVAYRQPITRPEIDDIRGVDSSATLRILLDRGLLRVLGKREEVGRPMLYGTTMEFLDFFSLSDLRELPTLREYAELTDESRRSLALAELEGAPEPSVEPD